MEKNFELSVTKDDIEAQRQTAGVRSGGDTKLAMGKVFNSHHFDKYYSEFKRLFERDGTDLNMTELWRFVNKYEKASMQAVQTCFRPSLDIESAHKDIDRREISLNFKKIGLQASQEIIDNPELLNVKERAKLAMEGIRLEQEDEKIDLKKAEIQIKLSESDELLANLQYGLKEPDIIESNGRKKDNRSKASE